MLFFRAASRPQRTRPLFDLVESGKVTLCLSSEVLIEIRDVLTRPKLTAKFPALTTEAVNAFLSQFASAARWLDDVPEHFVLSRDPKDSKYLNLAIEAGAPYVVSTDLDLLDLMTSDDATAADFRRRFPNVHIVAPAEFEAAVVTAKP
jgi:putative PIN family toxin of toxin-antitoxin system